jgi:haloalkane dehalogenase
MNETQPAWLDTRLYPFAPRTFETPHGRMHYIDEGSGPPILFVHGTPSWSFEWRVMVRELSSRARCVAIDHLGFGLSDKPEDAPLRPEDHAARLASFVDALGLDDFVLVVHDFGGPIGLPLALGGEKRVRHVVALNTWMWPVGDDPRVARIDRVVRSSFGRFLYRWLNASPRWLLPASFADKSALTPELHRHYMRPFGTRHERTAPWVLATELVGSRSHYASLWEKRDVLAHVPTTLVWGTRDPAVGADALARFREAVPSARVIETRAGHFPQEEDAAAVVAAIAAAVGR